MNGHRSAGYFHEQNFVVERVILFIFNAIVVKLLRERLRVIKEVYRSCAGRGCFLVSLWVKAK